MLSLQKGQTLTVNVDLVNDQDTSKNVFLGVEYRRQGPCKTPVNTWCTVRPNRFRLEKGARQRVQLELQGYEDGQGECVLLLFVGEKVNTPIPLNIRFGLPVFVRLNGEQHAEGQVLDIRTLPLSGTGDWEIRIPVKNNGFMHLAPFGMVWLENAKHERIWQSDLRPDRPIFPGETQPILWKGPKPELTSPPYMIGVQLFWGTLYGVSEVGLPKKDIEVKRVLSETLQ